VRQVGYLQELNRDARSTEHKISGRVKLTRSCRTAATVGKLYNDTWP